MEIKPRDATMQQAFIIRAFNTKKDSSGKEIDFERVHRELIAPALDAAKLGGGTTGKIIDAGNIREDMFGLIIEADLVVCDITVHNANVFYELGIRHALRKKGTVLIKGMPVADSTPFDILTDRYLEYSVDEPGAKKAELAEVIRATLATSRETDSPIFKMLPTLPEIDPTAVQVVPTDFSEEVARAQAAKAAGWLRLLASEVTDRRFQWSALRSIGKAQWQLMDYVGARRTWLRVREAIPDDLDANLALTNLLERQYRCEKRPELLEASNQAIANIVASKRATAEQRAEALALHGRNLKTLWRLNFESLGDLADRRQKATNRSLIGSYEAYRQAYLVDLNHYWSGLAALQMGTVALDLAGESAWEDSFDDAEQAAAYKTELARQVEATRVGVRLAVNAAIERLAREGKDRAWAAISRADLLFLTAERDPHVVQAYRDAVPKSDAFAWEAARGQLQLFARVGVRAERAERVISELDAYVERAEPAPDLHLVVAVGHRVDERGRAVRRFPADAEPQVRELIRAKLKTLQVAGINVEVLASAAPGADIICHEICKELRIKSSICLPMPPNDFAGLAFGELDGWRSRFLELIKGHQPLQLSDQPGLPRWLQASKLDPWERGNHWVLEMAQTSGAAKITLLALWDGKAEGDARGGTADMVKIARDAGGIDVQVIDAAPLLAGPVGAGTSA
jgi:hypothetical protein